MAGFHMEEGCEQVRGKNFGPSTRGRKDSLVMPFLALRDDSSG